MLSKLQRRADDAVETRDGQLALKMRVKHGKDKEGNNFFRFRSTHMAPITVVTWSDEQFAILEEDTARYLLRSGYAIGLDDEEIEAYNKAVDDENAVAKKKQDEQTTAKKAADEKAAAAKLADEKAAADKKAAAEKEAAAAKAPAASDKGK
ncbi:MAG TPA: hypothetical protein VIT23_12775 [Terrimicrobiaceae bacterium]